MPWLEFWRALLPGLVALAKDLHNRHGGRLDASLAELAQIRDHGRRLDAAQDRIDHELNELSKG